MFVRDEMKACRVKQTIFDMVLSLHFSKARRSGDRPRGGHVVSLLVLDAVDGPSAAVSSLLSGAELCRRIELVVILEYLTPR